jgi:glucokinase
MTTGKALTSLKGEPSGAAAGQRGGRAMTARSSRPATGEVEGTLDVLRQLIGSLRDQHPSVEAIGAGAAGKVEWPAGHIRWAPNNAHRDLPLRHLLAQQTGLPAVPDNEANAAAWAEARHGAAADYRHAAVVTVPAG